MSHRPTPLERAFELARTGEYASVGEIKLQLSKEGLAHGQIEGPVLVRQLRDLCNAARDKAG
jgi:hypothetical protein